MILLIIILWLFILDFFNLYFLTISTFLDWSSASCCLIVNEALLRRDCVVKVEMSVRSDISYTLRNEFFLTVLVCEIALLFISFPLVLFLLCLFPAFLDTFRGAWLVTFRIGGALLLFDLKVIEFLFLMYAGLY